MSPDGVPPLALSAALVSSAYLGVFGVGELLRRLGMPGTATRRAVHVLSCLPALAVPVLFAAPEPVLLLGLGFTVLMLASRQLGLLMSIHAIDRSSVGAMLYPPAVALAFALAGGSPAYYVAVLALGVGDATAGFVGARWGRRAFRCWGQVRSVEGSIACGFATFGTSAAVLVVAGEQANVIASATLIAVAVVLAEACAPRGLDNASIPAAALALVYLSHVPLAAIGLIGLLAVIVGAGADGRALAVRAQQPFPGGPRVAESPAANAAPVGAPGRSR